MINVEHLYKEFGDLEALYDINLSINDGDVVSLIGPSGSGKSTLLRCINGLETYNRGLITLDNQKMDIKDKKKFSMLRKKMGFVFQHFNLFNNKTVIDNCTLAPITVLNKSKEEAIKIAETYLDKVGLIDKVNEYPSKLSGGQKQRVAIARALCMEPEIMLFDEPTSALDPEMIKEVLDVMQKLSETNMTMIIVTHEMNFARKVGNRVVFLDEGKIIEENNAETFFADPKTKRAKDFLAKVLYN